MRTSFVFAIVTLWFFSACAMNDVLVGQSVDDIQRMIAIEREQEQQHILLAYEHLVCGCLICVAGCFFCIGPTGLGNLFGPRRERRWESYIVAKESCNQCIIPGLIRLEAGHQHCLRARERRNRRHRWENVLSRVHEHMD